MNSFAKHKAEVAKQCAAANQNCNKIKPMQDIQEVRQGAENAFSVVENATFYCKINDIEPVEMPAVPAHLQNILERI